jgi:pyruvate/2-oxoglutarate dehydrogenase complex dihydrolipoamide dehydrogenase (E3) component
MLLEKYNVKLIGNQKIEEITSEGVKTIDRNWKNHFYEADTVVTAFGLVPNDEGIEEMLSLIPEAYAIGDCWDGPKTIGNANNTAFNYAIEI